MLYQRASGTATSRSPTSTHTYNQLPSTAYSGCSGLSKLRVPVNALGSHGELGADHLIVLNICRCLLHFYGQIVQFSSLWRLWLLQIIVRFLLRSFWSSPLAVSSANNQPSFSSICPWKWYFLPVHGKARWKQLGRTQCTARKRCCKTNCALVHKSSSTRMHQPHDSISTGSSMQGKWRVPLQPLEPEQIKWAGSNK